MDVVPPRQSDLTGPPPGGLGNAPEEAPAQVPWTPGSQSTKDLPVTWQPPDDGQPIVAYRSARVRSIVVMVLLAATAVANLLKIVHYAAFDQLVDDVQAGVAGAAEGAAFDNLTAALIGVYAISVLACGLAYMAWLSRGVDNAPALGGGTPLRSPRGAIGWWFAPFANFVVPYLIVRDLHDRLAIATDRASNRALLLGWWLLWNGTNIAGVVIGQLGVGRSLDDVRATIIRQQIQDGLLIVAAVLAILVVRRIQGREDARGRALLDGSAAGDPAVVPASA